MVSLRSGEGQGLLSAQPSKMRKGDVKKREMATVCTKGLMWLVLLRVVVSAKDRQRVYIQNNAWEMSNEEGGSAGFPFPCARSGHAAFCAVRVSQREFLTVCPLLK